MTELKNNYNSNQSSNPNSDPEIPLEIKVVLLGETAVGKTSIISRFVDGKFVSNFVPTMSGAYSSKIQEFKEDNKKLKFEIWDTAGQERYRSINKIFYKDASVAILVYDITRKDTFQEIKNFWYKEVRDNSNENIIIAIAGNKIDYYEYEEVNKNEVLEFSEKIGAIFKGTSAKTGIGIDDLFLKIGLKIIDPVNFNNRINESKGQRIKKKNSILISSNVSTDNKNDVFVDRKNKNCC